MRSIKQQEFNDPCLSHSLVCRLMVNKRKGELSLFAKIKYSKEKPFDFFEKKKTTYHLCLSVCVLDVCRPAAAHLFDFDFPNSGMDVDGWTRVWSNIDFAGH